MRTYQANDGNRYKWKVTLINLDEKMPAAKVKLVNADNDVNAVQRACGDFPEWLPGITVGTLRSYYLSNRNLVVKDVEKMSRDEVISSIFQTHIIAQYNDTKGYIDPKHFHKPYGVHGVGHTSRVLLHTLNLCSLPDLRILRNAAVYHDIGRTHDWEDEVHGRSAIRKLEELGIMGILFQKEEDEKLFRYIVEQHCTSDKTGLDSAWLYAKDTERAHRLLKTFKDADGLDRVRLGDLDPKYLRHEESKRLVRKAQELFNNW